MAKRFSRFLASILWLAAAFSSAATAQSASSFHAGTLYVEGFSGGDQARYLHDSIVRQLSKKSAFHLISTPSGADAILKGSGQIWIRGHISTNARTPANNRQAVYGGYLSLQLVASDGQPLWSWLATPSRLRWTNIVDDLAGQAVKRLVASEGSLSTAAAGPASGPALVQTSLSGAGATFPAPLYQKWLEDFEQLHNGVRIQYQPIGSQAGVNQLLSGKVDFAGSDVAPEVLGGAAASSHLHRVASVLGAVVVIYNLNGSTEDLHLTPEALAGIYLGRIRRWNDPEIRRSNKGTDLPDAEIAVIHRSDGSGTTWVWSDYLSKVSPAWSSAMGRGLTLHWTVGAGAEGSEGVAEAVEKTPNSIGYVELAYAIQNRLSFAAVRNRAGEFIHADLDSLAEAATTADAAGTSVEDITDPPGKSAYPISSFTWLLLPETTSPEKKAALTEFLRWILNAGQKECSSLGYAPLPRSMASSMAGSQLDQFGSTAPR